jgi:type I restriction enzyme S subunit
MSAPFESLESPRIPLAELLRERSRNGLSVAPSNDPPGRPILRISAGTSRDDGIVDETDFRYVDVGEREASDCTLSAGDLLACRFNGNLHYVGKFSLFAGETGRRLLHPDKLIRFRVDPEHALPEYVRDAMNSSIGRAAIESFCQTTAGNIGISAKNLNTVSIPVPPITEQRRIVRQVMSLREKVTELNRLQQQSSSPLDAALPSILDRAFKGDL